MQTLLRFTHTVHCTVWQYGLLSFQMGGTKMERFLPKNQHTQRKFLNWFNKKVSKVTKFDQNLNFKVNFLYYPNLSHFFLSLFKDYYIDGRNTRFCQYTLGEDFKL